MRSPRRNPEGHVCPLYMTFRKIKIKRFQTSMTKKGGAVIRASFERDELAR